MNAQLIDARTDAHLWAQTYDRDLADVFAIQSEIAQTIAGQLQAKLSPNEQKAIKQPPTTDLEAHDLYLRARVLDELSNDPNGREYLLQAAQLLDEATQRDPNFLLAYCLLVEVHTDLYWGAFDHTPARLELARAALEKAEPFVRMRVKFTWPKAFLPTMAIAIMPAPAPSLPSLAAPCQIPLTSS